MDGNKTEAGFTPVTKTFNKAMPMKALRGSPMTNHVDRSDIKDIAADKGLDSVEKFADFIEDRFNDPHPAYVREWANRILDGAHFSMADHNTQESLKRAGYGKKPTL